MCAPVLICLLMKNKWIWIVVASLVVISLTFAFFPFSGKSNVQPWEPIVVSADSLPGQLEHYSAIQALPEDAQIMLIVGNNEYRIDKGKVSKGAVENPDIVISIPESYFAIMGQYGWCSALASANNNGDLGLELRGSSASLAWKYRGLIDYKNCLG